MVGTGAYGVYQMTVNADGTFKSADRINTSGTGIIIPFVTYGWIQKIDNAHYLIGTQARGV